MEEIIREVLSPKFEFDVITGALDMLKELWKRRIPIIGIDSYRIDVDPLVMNLILANLEFCRLAAEARAKAPLVIRIPEDEKPD